MQDTQHQQQQQTKESTQQLPPKMSFSGQNKNEGYMSMSQRFRPACTCLNRPGSVRCARHGYVVPGERLKKRLASKEILRRALTPPPKRLGLRWLNFKPTPSRLSIMSMASWFFSLLFFFFFLNFLFGWLYKFNYPIKLDDDIYLLFTKFHFLQLGIPSIICVHFLGSSEWRFWIWLLSFSWFDSIGNVLS